MPSEEPISPVAKEPLNRRSKLKRRRSISQGISDMSGEMPAKRNKRPLARGPEEDKEIVHQTSAPAAAPTSKNQGNSSKADPSPLPISPALPDTELEPKAKDAAADTPTPPDYLPAETRVPKSGPEILQFWGSNKFMIPTSDERANIRWNYSLIFNGNTEPLTESVLLSLRLAIMSLAHNAFQWLNWEDLSTKSRAYISSWAPDAKMYFNSPRDVPKRSILPIHQAWVSHILWDHLFSPEGSLNKWHGPHWTAYGKLRRELEAHLESEDNCFVRCFHFWRYSTVHMLYMIHGKHSDEARLKAILREELQDVIKKTKEATEGVDRLISDVTRMAVLLDLAAEAHQRKVVFHMDHPGTHEHFGFPFDLDSNIMEHYQTLDMGVKPEVIKGRQVHFVTDMGVRIYGEELFGTELAFNRSSSCEHFTHNYAKLSQFRAIKVSPDMDGICDHELGAREGKQRGDPEERAPGDADTETEHERVSEGQATEAQAAEGQATEAQAVEAQAVEGRSQETEE